MDRDGQPDRRPWMRLAGVGFELAAAVGGFALVGHFIDRWKDSHPKGLLIGAVLGLIGGMYNLIKASLAANRDAREIDREVARATRSEEAAENDRKELREDERDGR
jgi:F0F1-type ATP synthase assembly protein I